MIYRVTEKKEHQTNKRTVQTTFIYLRQSLFLKQITFHCTSREMTFSFPYPASQGQQVGGGKTEINRKEDIPGVLISSHCLSFSGQVEGMAVPFSFCHMSEMVHSL